jgi:hypothetical protein
MLLPVALRSLLLADERLDSALKWAGAVVAFVQLDESVDIVTTLLVEVGPKQRESARLAMVAGPSISLSSSSGDGDGRRQPMG